MIYSQGKPTDNLTILCQGSAISFNRLADGRRVIQSFLLSGDPISLNSLFKDTLPLSVEAITDCQIAFIKREDLVRAVTESPELLSAIWNAHSTETQAALQHVISLAAHTAQERVVSILLTLARRMERRKIAGHDRYPLSFRQQDIAEFAGLTAVHVNRVISELRKAEILETSRGGLDIVNIGRLKELLE